MERDQRRPPSSYPPLWRLLAEEIGLLAVRVGRALVSAVAALTATAVFTVLVAFSERTPGPSLELAWRAAAAAVAAVTVLAVWAVAHAVRRDRRTNSDTL